MTKDVRYFWQQEAIAKIAEEIGVCVFRPDYHGKKGDKNTVMLYFADDEKFNRTLDAEEFPDSNKYKKPFFVFENTDVNGFESYSFANRGKIDLRVLNWEEVLKGHILLAYFLKTQIRYVLACGGLANIRECDDTYNDLNRHCIEAFRMAHGKAFLGDISFGSELYDRAQKEDVPVFREYKNGDMVYNFDCVFAIPEKDEDLKKFILSWNRDHRLPKDTSILEDITARIAELGGIEFVWY